MGWAVGVIFIVSVVTIVYSFTGHIKLVWLGRGIDFGRLNYLWQKVSLSLLGFVGAVLMLVCVGNYFMAAKVVNATITTEQAQQITVPIQVRDIPLFGTKVYPEQLSGLVIEEWELKTDEEQKRDLLEMYSSFPANTTVTGIPSSEPNIWGDLTDTERWGVIQEFTKPDTVINFELS